jgi:hypothetical protein
MIALSDADMAKIDSISRRRGKYPASDGGIRVECFAAGIAAGLDRAAKVCRNRALQYKADMSRETIESFLAAKECERAIRLLNAPAAP